MNALSIDIGIIWGSYIVTIAIGTIYICHSMTKESKNGDKEKTYNVNSARPDSYKTIQPGTVIMIIGRILLELSAIGTIGIVLGENAKYRSYWNGMGEYVDELPSIAFNMWMSIIGLLVVFVTFTKKTWLTFSVYDIISKFDIKKVIGRMGVRIIFCNVIYFFKPFQLYLPYSLYFAIRLLGVCAILWVMYDFIRLIILLIDSYFGDKMEKLFMESLYRELWKYPIRKTSSSEGWKDENIIKKHVGYMRGEILRFSGKIKFNELKSIDFVTDFCAEKGEKSERYKGIEREGFNAFLFSWLIYVLISVTMVWGAYSVDNNADIKSCIYFLAFTTLLTLGVGIFIRFIPGLGYSFYLTFIFIICGRSGYELKFEKNGKARYKYVSEAPLFKNKYTNFICSINNIIAFYMIAPDEAKDKIKEALKKEHEMDKVLWLPLSVIEFVENLNEEGAKIPQDIYQRQSEIIDNCVKGFCIDLSTSGMGMTKENCMRKINGFFPKTKEEEKSKETYHRLCGMIRRNLFIKGQRHDKKHNHIQKPNNPYTLS